MTERSLYSAVIALAMQDAAQSIFDPHKGGRMRKGDTAAAIRQARDFMGTRTGSWAHSRIILADAAGINCDPADKLGCPNPGAPDGEWVEWGKRHQAIPKVMR